MKRKEIMELTEETVNWVVFKTEIEDLPAIAEILEMKALWIREKLLKGGNESV